jgi:predicted esterase
MILGAILFASAQVPIGKDTTAPLQSVTSPAARPFPLPDDAVGYRPNNAGPNAPLLVLLHGAGRSRLWMIEQFEAEADARGIVLLAPTSRGITWDTVLSAKAPPSPDSPLANEEAHRFSRTRDSDRVEAAIANLAKIVPVDHSRIALAGFSDGATFALAMGVSRDHHFAAVIAWSPGIAITTESPARGRPVFISHGRKDAILSFDDDCGEIVPLVQSEGARVTFLPFDGGHEIPQIAKDAFLDAVFGPIPGSAPHPLPTTMPVCHGQTGSMDQ